MNKSVTIIGSPAEVFEAVSTLDNQDTNCIFLGGNELLAPNYLPVRDYCGPFNAPVGIQGRRASVKSFAESGSLDSILWLRNEIRQSEVVYIDSDSDLLNRMVRFVARQEGKSVLELSE